MLTGRLPFAGKSAALSLDAKIKGSPEHPCERTPAHKIPAPVDALVMRALARHPALRFQSATEMRQAAEAVLEAPARARVTRRMMGFAAFAALMAFATVLVAGKAGDLGHAAVWLFSAPPGEGDRSLPARAPDPAPRPTSLPDATVEEALASTAGEPEAPGSAPEAPAGGSSAATAPGAVAGRAGVLPSDKEDQAQARRKRKSRVAKAK
jgi:serine/threonine-protein kinase